MAEHRLSRLQRRILAWLVAEDQRTRGTMAASHEDLVRALVALGFDKGNVSTSLKGLAAKGLVTITRTPGGKAEAVDLTPAMTFVAVPEIQELLSLVKDLHVRVGALEQTRVPTALPAPPATPVTPAPPAPPAAERKDIQQWAVRLSKALIEHLKAVGYERRIPPSQLVEELLWKALTDQLPSMS